MNMINIKFNRPQKEAEAATAQGKIASLQCPYHSLTEYCENIPEYCKKRTPKPAI